MAQSSSFRLKHASALERLGRTLREFYDGVQNEELPQRWVDLIHHLNERERQERDARNRGTESKPKM